MKKHLLFSSINVRFVVVCLLIAVISGTSVVAASSPAQHVEFMDGVGDYAGLQYTTIGFDMSDPFGGSGPFMQIVDRLAAAPDGREIGGHNGLVRFANVQGCEAGQIPPGATILSAKLRMYLASTTLAGGTVSNSPDFIQNVHVYGLQRIFDENSATWTESEVGVPWEELGGWGFSDRNPLPDDTLVATLPGYYVWDVTASLQQQLDQSQEFGWLFLSPDALARNGDNTRWGPQALLVDFTAPRCNASPVANNDSYSMNEDTSLVVLAQGVTANDTDDDGDSLTVMLVTPPVYGDVSLNGDGAFTYTPAINFNGSDSFSYYVNDGITASNVAVVTLNVSPINDAPVASDDAAMTSKNTAVTISVLDNDSDIDGSALRVGGVTGNSKGHSVIINTDGTITFTPKRGFKGIDTFTYIATDGLTTSNVATVSVQVTP